MATKIGGRARVFINGVQYPVRGDVVIMLGKASRASVVGVDGVHGITETPVASWCEFSLSHLPDVDIEALQDLVDCTVNIELDNGVQAVLRNAAQVNAIELNQADGKFTVKFESSDGVFS